MQLQYYQMMTPRWLQKHAKWNVNARFNDVEVTVAQDTRMNESLFELPIVDSGTLDDTKSVVVSITAGLEYKDQLSFASMGRGQEMQRRRAEDQIGQLWDAVHTIQNTLQQHQNTLNDHEKRIAAVEREQQRLRDQIAALQAQIAALQARMTWRPRDPMCITVSDDLYSNGFEIRDPEHYPIYGPYRGVQGGYGPRGLLNSVYFPEVDDSDENARALEPVESTRWPQLYKMQLRFDPSDPNQGTDTRAWGRMYSDIDGGHSVSLNYTSPVEPWYGLKFTVYRGEVNEVYHINYFEVAVYQ